MTISSMRHVISRLAALVLLFAGVEQSRADVLALEFASGTPNEIGAGASIGWSFTTNTAINITALDALNVAAEVGSEVRLRHGLRRMAEEVSPSLKSCDRVVRTYSSPVQPSVTTLGSSQLQFPLWEAFQ